MDKLDKLTEYSNLMKRILNEYIELCDRHPNSGIEMFLITEICETLGKVLCQLKLHIYLLNQKKTSITGETATIEICHDLTSI